MRKVLLRVVLGFFTFVIGVSAVFLTSKPLAAHTETVLFVEPVYKSETGIPRFMPTGRGCGGGYSQGYVTDDDQRLAEGVRWYPSRKVIRREFRKLVREAEQVLERVEQFRDHRGEIVERIVILDKTDEDGTEWISIIHYDGGDSYRFIDAPTLELALEFERYLVSIDFKSPM